MIDSAERHDAFISYRHVPEDRKWAIWLHQQLERYRTPRPLVARGIPRRLKRVFRDEEELPASADLSDAIKSELVASRVLIVVCSPAAVSSKWINAEVEYFRRLKGSEHILSVLISGTAETAFPAALRSVQVEQHAQQKQTAQATPMMPGREPGAPRLLAGPFNFRERRRTVLRLLATLLNCRFDDLWQRDRKRTQKRMGAAATVAFTGLLMVAAVAWRLERRQIEELTNYSINHMNAKPSLSLVLGEVALQRTRRLEDLTGWLGGSKDDEVRRWLELAIYRSKLRRQLKMPQQPVQTVAWDEDGRILAGDYQGNVNIWSRSDDSPVAHRLFANGVQRLAPQAGSKTGTVALVTGQKQRIAGQTILNLDNGGDRDLHIWDPMSGSVRTQRLSRRQHSVDEAALAACTHMEGNWLATSVGSDAVSVWNARDAAVLMVLAFKGDAAGQKTGSWGSVNGLAWNPDCTKLAVATTKGLYLAEVRTGQVDNGRPAPPKTQNASRLDIEGFLAVDWSRDGRKLAVAVADRTVRLFPASGGPEQIVGSHQGAVTAVRWSHDGERLASVGADGIAIVWGLPEYSAQYEVLVGFYAHQGEDLRGVAWSPDDAEVVTVGDDDTVCVWSVSRAAQPVKLLRASGMLRLGKENRLFFNDRRLTDDELADLARQRAIRQLSAEERNQYVRSWFTGLFR